MVKISVIVPVYNNEKYLRECLDSVINQTFKDIEIICINSGLNENSFDVLDKFGNSDSRIKLLNANLNEVALLCNQALKDSRGDYVYFMNGDEILEDTTFENLYELSQDKHLEAIIFDLFNAETCEGYDFNDYECSLLNDIVDSNFFEFDYLKDNVFEVMSSDYGKFFKKDRLSNLNFNEDYIFEDYSFFIEAIFKSEHIYFDNRHYGCKKDSLFNLIKISNSFIETSKKYQCFETIKDILFNKKILRTYLRFSEIEKDDKKAFFDNIKEDFYSFQEDIKNCHLYPFEEHVFEESLRCDNYREFELSSLLFRNKIELDAFSMDFKHLHKNEFARIDIKNFGDKTNSLEIIDNSDTNSSVSFPNWFKNKHGVGSVIESSSNEITLKLKVVNDGKLKLWLRSIDLRDECGRRMETFIDYTSLSINGKNYLNGHNLFSHDDPFTFKKEVRNSEIIELHVEWTTYGKKNQDYTQEEKDVIYKGIRSNLLGFDFDLSVFKKIPVELYGFYVRVLNYEDYGQYENFAKELLVPHRFINKRELSEKMNDFSQWGLNKEKRDESIIVSLTSFPARMEDIHFCLYSLLNQSFKPDKVILYLAFEQFPNKEKDLPDEVLKLKENGLTIRWCRDIRSYKKLIPLLKESPDDFIVTTDDDIYYPPDWLEKIWKTYLEYPNTIISSRPRIILKDEEDKLLSYNQWLFNDELKKPSFFNFPTGAGGTMYFPHALPEDVFDEETFMELCPTGDDIWFWAMAIMNNTKITGIDNPYNDLIYINLAREAGVIDTLTLWNLNQDGQNDIQINNVLNRFPKIMDIINNG